MSSENKPLISFHLEKAIAFGKKTSPTTQCWFYTLICRPISVWCSNIEFSFRGINPRDLLLGWGCSIPSQQIHFLYPAREQSSFSNKKWFLNISASDGWDFLKVEFLQFSTVQFLPPPPHPVLSGEFLSSVKSCVFQLSSFPSPSLIPLLFLCLWDRKSSLLTSSGAIPVSEGGPFRKIPSPEISSWFCFSDNCVNK